MKLFPDVQQKTASGFLTTLWNQDASGNKWAVIARLYSYVRDEIGRPKVSLSEFLSFACPHMQIVRPEKYLEESGWRLEDGTGGCKTLVRVSSKPAHTGSTPLSVPHTEIELLICLVQDGYLSDKGLELLESLSASHQGLMTSHAGSGERKTTRDHAFNRFRASPTPSPAASNVFTPINKVEVETPASDKWFGFSSAASSFSCGEVLNIERVPEQQPFDIDNPWDVSRSFQCSTEQTHLGKYRHTKSQMSSTNFTCPESPASTQYDPREDFHYQF